MSTPEGSISVCHFWDLETFGFKETKYIDLKRPELQRYLVFNFCKQEFRFPSILSLDNWLPAAKGSVCFLLLGPNHPLQVPFLSWPCPHHPQNCSYHPQNCLCQQGSVPQQCSLFLGKFVFPEVQKNQKFSPDFHGRVCFVLILLKALVFLLLISINLLTCQSTDSVKGWSKGIYMTDFLSQRQCSRVNRKGLFFFFFSFYLFLNFILFFNFTILYWFCHISKWICHRYTCVPHPEPSSLLPPRTIPLGHPSALAPSI